MTTLTQVLDSHLERFLQSHRIPAYQLKALKAYRSCRTKLLGGHSQYCENGHLMGVWYNSCKRRGCPQCQGLSNERWLLSQKEKLLAATHHHWVFTLPHDILVLWRYNRPVMQDILFQSVARTLSQLAQDRQYLAARPAFMLALHTWGRNLSLHPHIHCLIAHGGLDDDSHWQQPQKSCLFPAKVMMQLFRGKFLAALRECNDLQLPPDMRPSQFRKLVNRLGRTDWVVHCCKPYRHGRGVVGYLSRYVKSGPIKNRQLLGFDRDSVTFGYQSHRHSRRSKAHFDWRQFILLLCEHVPQHRKALIRRYGLYRGGSQALLDTARKQLDQPAIRTDISLSWQEYLQQYVEVPICFICGASMKAPSQQEE